MATVIIERRHAQPATLDAIVAAHATAPHDVVPLAHALDPEAIRSLSIVHAENETAASALGTELAASQVGIWTATTNRDDGPDAFRRSVAAAGPGALALVDKRFPVAVEIGVPANNFDPTDWCLNMHGVRYLHSHLAPDARRMVCLYAAIDLETTVAAYRLIPVEVARIYRVVVDPITFPEGG